MKPLNIPAEVLSLVCAEAPADYRGTLIDAGRRAVVAADGIGCVIRPFPAGIEFPGNRLIPTTNEPLAFVPEMGVPTTVEWGWETLQPSPTPAYRLRLNAARLAKLAAAMETEEIILELPHLLTGDHQLFLKRPEPLPDGTVPYAFLAHGGGDGPLAIYATSGFQTPAPAAGIPAVIMSFNAAKSGVELKFAGKPTDEIREAMKDAGFRWHGQTKVWYARDTEARRTLCFSILDQLGSPRPASIPPVPVKQAA